MERGDLIWWSYFIGVFYDGVEVDLGLWCLLWRSTVVSRSGLHGGRFAMKMANLERDMLFSVVVYDDVVFAWWLTSMMAWLEIVWLSYIMVNVDEVLCNGVAFICLAFILILHNANFVWRANLGSLGERASLGKNCVCNFHFFCYFYMF